MKRILIFALLIMASSTIAADNQTLWKEAADFYDQGRFQLAIEDYNKLMERGLNNPELYYNLGNAYFKAHELGRSIWSYRRALLIEPGFKPAKTNLDYVRTFNTDQIAVKERGFILDIWDFVSGLMSADGYLTILLAAWWAAALIIAYRIIRINGAHWIYYLLIVSLLLVIFSGVSAARRISEDRLTHWGVLLQVSADIREGPGQDYKRVEVAHEGLEFRILAARENSFLIELENGLKGWVDKKAVLEI